MQITQRPYTAPKMAARAQVKPQAKPVFKGQIGGHPEADARQLEELAKAIGSRAVGSVKGTFEGFGLAAEAAADLAKDETKHCPKIIQGAAQVGAGIFGGILGAGAGFVGGLIFGDDDD